MKTWGLLAALAMVAFGSLFVGAAGLSFAETWDGLLASVGLAEGGTIADGVVANIRMPRIFGGILLGGALAVAGVGLQGVYRTPVIEPYLVGVSSAGGLGLVVGSLIGGASLGTVTGTILAALTGAALAWLTTVVARSARDGSGFVLSGLAIGLALLAWTLLLIFLVDSPRLPTFTYFVFGGLGTATWRAVLASVGFVAIGAFVVQRSSRQLDIMALGDDQARSLGVAVPEVRREVLLASGGMAGATVALAGVVGFLGLLAPLVARRLVGQRHRRVIPAAALIGALMVLVADTFVRGIGIPVEVPLGVVTASIGGPVFVYLLWRR